MWFLTIFVALFEIFSPLLIAVLNIPQEIRWLSHFANLLIIIFYLFRRIKTHRIYSYDLFLAIISIISVTVALANRQQFLPTIWGLWLFLRYPLIGFAIREEKFTLSQNRTIEKIFYSTLFIEIFVQLIQSLSGIPSGDDLAGTFYNNGTGMLLLVELIILAYFSGKWISEKKLKGLIITLVIGIISGALGEMKLFFFASIMISLVSVFLYYLRYRFDKRILFGITTIFIVFLSFPTIIDKLTYNQTNSLSFLSQITDSSYITRYTSFVMIDANGRYNVGRNYMVQYVLKVISSDKTRFVFGDGIGSRGESKSLGSAGVQLLSGDLGLLTGQSLVVFLGEMGVLSVVYLVIFMFSTMSRCVRIIRINQEPYLASLGYAVLLFSVFWPIWLWYNTAWTLPGSMPLYWLMWGVVMHYSQRSNVPNKKQNEI